MENKHGIIKKMVLTIFILISVVSCANINLNDLYTNVNEASERILESNENIRNLTVYVRNTKELNTLCNALRLRKNNIEVSLDLTYSDFNYIGESFSDCDSLVSVKLPDSLVAIDANAFRGCDNLYGIEIPQGVKVIKPYAFYGCSNLQNITFKGSKCSSIEYGAFMECPNLRWVNIPSSIKKIGINAFSLSNNINFSVQGYNSWSYYSNNKTEYIILNDSASYSWRYELAR